MTSVRNGDCELAENIFYSGDINRCEFQSFIPAGCCIILGRQDSAKSDRGDFHFCAQAQGRSTLGLPPPVRVSELPQDAALNLPAVGNGR